MQICFSESVSQGTRPKTVGAKIGPRNQTQNEVLELYHPSVSNKDLIYDGMWLLIRCYCAVIKTFIGHVLGLYTSGKRYTSRCNGSGVSGT